MSSFRSDPIGQQTSNQTGFRYSVLLVEGIKGSPESNLISFILFLIVFILIIAFNLGILIQITAEKSLHQPMLILFCNLPVNDILGVTVILPRLMRDVLTDPSQRYITYMECVGQAYFTHLYGSTSHTILMIMAFDRYLAICRPLRYPAIMTTKTMVALSAGAWGSIAALVGVMIGLTVRLSHCRYLIQNHFCDNASLFKLSCENITVNNVYGLTYTALLISISMLSVVFTYTKIALVCFRSKNKATNLKAVKTCSTHLIVYLIMLISGFVVIVLHRFPEFTESRKLSSIMLHIIPPCLNPIIYGLQANKIRRKILHLFCKRKVGLM